MNQSPAQAGLAPNQDKRISPRHAGEFVVLAFCVLVMVVVANEALHFWDGQGWLLAAVVVMGLTAGIAAFMWALPWPNVLLAAGLAAFMGGMAHAVGSVGGFPFGDMGFAPQAGPELLGLFPWWVPVIWAVAALTSRGTARYVLHRWRHHPIHGYRVIGLAAVLAGAMTVGLEVYGRGARLWSPNPTPALSLFSALVLHLFIQVAMTPLLIDKFPGQRSRNLRPLVVWTVLNLALLAGIFILARDH